jgi:soluble lytic murein transglycosylase-like protein
MHAKICSVSPGSEKVARVLPAPPSRWPIVLFAGFNLILVAVVVIFGLRLLEGREAQATALQTAIDRTASELEQLRVDVTSTSSENLELLKIMLLKPGIDKRLARDIAHSVVMRARDFHRDPDLILAIIDVESDFNPSVVSHAGAIGLMQVMPLWIEQLDIKCDLREVDCNIEHGLKILAQYQAMFRGIETALTAYNRGPNAVVKDMHHSRNPFNGYAESVMRAYNRIKSWSRP